MARDEAYREAERRIEQAWQKGATELDLSSMKLTEVPEAIGSLSQMQTLYLYKNQLRAVPEAMHYVSCRMRYCYTFALDSSSYNGISRKVVEQR